MSSRSNATKCLTERQKMRTLLIAIVLMFQPGLAFAQKAKTSDPKEFLTAIERTGATAKFAVGEDGDPYIIANEDDLITIIIFYSCEQGKKCKSLQFYSGFEVDLKSEFDTGVLIKLNNFNKKYRYGKAYIRDRKSIATEFDLILNEGADIENFIDAYRKFRNTARELEIALR
jgi:hypothetical protein